MDKELLVEEETSIYTLTPEDFGYPDRGIEIVGIVPDSLRVTQEQADVKVITNLADERYLTIRDRPEGYEVGVQRVEPAEIRIRGPKSVLALVNPAVRVSMGGRQTFKGEIAVEPAHPESVARLVAETVHMEPEQVSVEVHLKASIATHEAKDVRLEFLFTPPAVPVRFKADSLSDWRLPLGFEGPKDQIARLVERIKEPGFSVAVLVPQLTDLEVGDRPEFTFTEGDLVVLGFPDVQVRPYEESSRKLHPYQIVTVKEAEK